MASHAQLRRINQRRILRLVLQQRRVSRADLARAAGISQPTVSRIVDQLLEDGILMESRPSDAAHAASGNDGAAPATIVGRPSAQFELNNRRPRFAAIQIGVRQTRLVAVPIAVPRQDQWDQAFATPAGLGEWQEQLAEAWKQLPTRRPKALVVSLPGVVDEQDGRVLLSPNLRWTEGADLTELIKPICRSPILFVQELRALALGHLAVEAGGEDFLLVDFGAGVGAAAVARGRLYSGPLPLSGELGHTPVLGNARVCGCGSIGCVETLVSRRGLVAGAAEHGHGTTWPQFVQHVQTHGLAPWLERSLEAAAIAIASALNVLGLRQVVLTGCLAELPPAVAEFLGSAIRDATMWAKFGHVTCRTAPRHRLAGMVSLAIERTLLSPTP